MLTPEAGRSAVHRAAFAADAPTALTRAFTGRRARGIVNRFVHDHDADRAEGLPTGSLPDGADSCRRADGR